MLELSTRTFRIDKEIMDKISILAKKEGRSVNSYVSLQLRIIADGGNPVMERNAVIKRTPAEIEATLKERNTPHSPIGSMPLLPEDTIPKKTESNPDPSFYKGLDLDEENPVFDFGDDTILNMNKYSKFPSIKKPDNQEEYSIWSKKKKIFDEKVMKAWAIHRKR